MALPTTISGIATTPACVGPFKSSGGNYYFFGVDSSTATTLQAYKATDPTVSFSSIATQTGYSTSILNLAAFQVGDTIHIALVDGFTSTIVSSNVNVKYIQFSMSSDTFSANETIQASFNPSTSTTTTSGCAIVVRSDGHVIVVYNGARAAVMGTSYSRIVAKRRTGASTWVAADGVTNPTPLDAGGALDFINPDAVLGSSDRTHFFFEDSTSLGTINTRTLRSANTLSANAAQSGALITSPCVPISYDASGTQKIRVIMDSVAADLVGFDSADSPTWSVIVAGNGNLANLSRFFNDGTDLYLLALRTSDSDLYVLKSTDNGSTWGSGVSAHVGTISNTSTNLSQNGAVYQRGGDYVIPFVVNDNGTLKYNEYVVRAGASPQESTPVNFIGKFKPQALAALSLLRHNIAADDSVAQAQPSTPVHFIGKFKPNTLLQQKGLWLSSAADVPPFVQPETNVHFIGRFSPSRYLLLPQLRQTPSFDDSTTATQPETNTHFIGKFKADRPTLLPLLRHNIAADYTSTVAFSTPVHFIGKFQPYRYNLSQPLRQNIAADDSTAQAQVETNVHFLGKFRPDRFVLSSALWQNTGFEPAIVVAETNTHFIGRFQPYRYALQVALRQNTAFEPPTVEAETNTHFVGKFTPHRFTLLASLRQTVAADDSAPQTQPETNVHFLGKFNPQRHNLLALLRHNIAADFTSTVAFATNIHFVGKFSPYRYTLTQALRQNIAADVSTVDVQPETNTHFLAKFAPTRIAQLSLLRHTIAADFTSTVQPSTPLYQVARFAPTTLRLNAALRQNIAADTSTPQTQAETNTHFVGRFVQPKIAKLASLWQTTGTQHSIVVVDASMNFVGKFRPTTLRTSRALHQTSAQDTSFVAPPSAARATRNPMIASTGRMMRR